MFACVSLAFWGGMMGARLLWFVLWQPARALRAAVDAARAGGPSAMPRCEERSHPHGLCVIGFTGTGEVRESAQAALGALLAEVPEAGAAELVVVPAPTGQGAYGSPHSFGAHMWSEVEDVVRARPGPFLLIGMSRGALVALDVGMRIASEQGKAAGVLALSPPLSIPARLQPVVVLLAALAGPMEQAAKAAAHAPRAALGMARRAVRVTYLWMTALILRDLRMEPGGELAHVERLLDGADPLTAALVALREFRLLTEVNARDAELFVRDVARVGADDGGFVVTCMWGERDHWLDPRASAAAITAELARSPSAMASIRSVLVEGRGHALHRERGADATLVVAATRRLLHELSARQRQLHRRRQDACAVEDRAREEPHD